MTMGRATNETMDFVLFSLSPLSPSFFSIPVLPFPSSTSFLWMFKIKRKRFYITIVLESKIIHICDVSWICNTSFFLNAIPMLTTVITLTRSKGSIRLKLFYTKVHFISKIIFLMLSKETNLMLDLISDSL